MRKSNSLCSLAADAITPLAPDRKSWSLFDATQSNSIKPILPLVSFNHIAREVINIEKSKNFYCDLLGFVVVPRPPFECSGYWLWGYGLSLHIVETRDKVERKAVLRARYSHFTKALPRVDHFAFMTNDINRVKSILEEANVYFTHEKPPGTGFEQLFFFDPDGNVIEVSTCSAAVGSQAWCAQMLCSTEDSTTTAATSTQDVHDALMDTERGHFALIEPMAETVESVVMVDNRVKFQFGDGTKDEVVLEAAVIKDISDYHYEDSDFVNSRLSSRTTSEDIEASSPQY